MLYDFLITPYVNNYYFLFDDYYLFFISKFINKSFNNYFKSKYYSIAQFIVNKCVNTYLSDKKYYKRFLKEFKIKGNHPSLRIEKRNIEYNFKNNIDVIHTFKDNNQNYKYEYIFKLSCYHRCNFDFVIKLNDKITELDIAYEYSLYYLKLNNLPNLYTFNKIFLENYIIFRMKKYKSNYKIKCDDISCDLNRFRAWCYIKPEYGHFEKQHLKEAIILFEEELQKIIDFSTIFFYNFYDIDIYDLCITVISAVFETCSNIITFKIVLLDKSQYTFSDTLSTLRHIFPYKYPSIFPNTWNQLCEYKVKNKYILIS